MKIIAVANQKGGVGKTTTAVNVFASLPGRKMLIDMDPQGNATIGLGIDPDETNKTIFSLLTGRSLFDETIITTKWGDLLPANDDLSELDMILIMNRDKINPITMLYDTLESHKADYDYIVIDCPPSKGLLTINVLTAATHVLIPMQCEYFATKGVNKILETIKNTKEQYNPSLKLLGIVGTMFVTGTNLSSVVLQEARKYFIDHNVNVFNTVIYRTVKFAQSPMHGVPAIDLYDNEHVQAYRELTKEIING